MLIFQADQFLNHNEGTKSKNNGSRSHESGSAARGNGNGSRGDGHGRSASGRSGNSSSGRAAGRAGSRSDQRAVAVEGAVAEARSITSSTGGHVGTGLATALVVSISAHLGAGSSRARGDGAGGNVRLGDGAGAVGDGEGGGLGDSVGHVVVGQSRGLRAVGGDGGDDLGGVHGAGSTGRLGASSRGDQRSITAKGVVAQARGIAGSTSSHVGIGLTAALVVGSVASLSALILGSCGGCGSDRLADGARAVSDGQGCGGRDGVGLVVVGEGSGGRAVGSQGSDNFGGVDDVASGGVGDAAVVSIVGGGLNEAGSQQKGNSSAETHLCVV